MIYYKKYILREDAEWVVFIHGAGGSSSIWHRQLRAYNNHYNLLLVDLRGHGKSAEIIQQYVKNKYTFEDVSEDVVEAMDHAGVEKAHFLGISLGTILIRSIAEKYPERVQSMVLGGAITRLNVRSRLLVNLGNAVKSFVPFMWLYKLLAIIIMPKKRHRQSRLLFIREAKRIAKKEIQKWYHLINELNPLLRYFSEKELKIPTLYIMGAEDYMFLGPVEKIAREHQWASLHVIPNSGHVCNVDQPEDFNHFSLRFLQNQG